MDGRSGARSDRSADRTVTGWRAGQLLPVMRRASQLLLGMNRAGWLPAGVRRTGKLPADCRCATR